MASALRSFAFVLIWALWPATAAAMTLPSRLAPDSPFPHIVEEAPTIERIAPGVAYGEYRLTTAVGPLQIHVVAIAPHRGDEYVSDVLANNALTSAGETVGSMAKRTGAVAGINGDYFDVGNTNRPTNIVVRDGMLLRMPRKRYALAITRDGLPQLTEFGFLGQLQIGDRTISLDGIDELPPPNGGTSLVTPAFGEVPPLQNVTLAALQLLSGTPPLARYRVTGVLDNLTQQPPGYYVAIGLNAYGTVNVPNPGDSVVASGDLSPIGLDTLATAIGGGPLILHDDAWYDDPDGPSGGEYNKRIPCSGAAIAPDGRLFLIEVDGREPSISVGLKRPEFAALMRALGATEGMAFDGGGSSTIAVRRPGDAAATLQNRPSDGRERRVADGIFVYSTAPVGPPVRLVAQPGTVRAAIGATLPLRIAAVDAAGHVAVLGEAPIADVSPAALGIFRNGRFTALQPGDGRIEVRSGALHGTVRIEVARSPKRVAIFPSRPNTERGGTLTFTARAYDAHGYALALPALLPWKATGGSLDALGVYRAGAHNANVSVRIGDAMAAVAVTVGSHDVALRFAEHARFMTLPHGGEGSVTRDPQCGTCVDLLYSFAGGERAAYAMAGLPLPPGTIGVSFDVLDDGSDARLRVALRNAINETEYIDATPLDRPGWRHVIVRFPSNAAPASTLVAIYVLPPKGMQLSNGHIVLRNVRAVVAGE